MRVVVFLICMCLLLLSGGNAAMTAHNNNASNTSARQIERKPQVKFKTSYRPRIVFADIDNCQQMEYFIIEEDEDENVNRPPAKKFKAINNCYLAFSNTFTLNNQFNGCNSSRPFYSLLSNKYISQRTLRI